MESKHVAGELAAQVESLMKSVQSSGPTDVDQLLGDITALAVDAVDGADDAGITVSTAGGEVETMASTGPNPALLDDIQSRYHEGPCLSAAWDQHTILIDDIETETRWPRYRREAMASTPVRSVMSFQMFSDTRTTGALNFYAEHPGAFEPESLELGLVLATHAALSWNLLRRDEQFRSALASRDVIGQAKGVIMERFDVNAIQAFDLLRRLSQDSNTPLADIAQRLVHDRQTG